MFYSRVDVFGSSLKTRPTDSQRSADLTRKRARYAQRTEGQRPHDAHQNVFRGAIFYNTWEALVLLQLNTVVSR